MPRARDARLLAHSGPAERRSVGERARREEVDRGCVGQLRVGEQHLPERLGQRAQLVLPAAGARVGQLELLADHGPDGAVPSILFCENETNTRRLYGSEPITPYPKDGINDHVVSGAATCNPEQRGTTCAFWYKVTVQPGRFCAPP